MSSSLFESHLDNWKHGIFIRKKFFHYIENYAHICVNIQKWRSPRLDKLMHLFSFLGTEDFYTALVIYFGIISDSRLAYLFIMLFSIGFYLTTFLKNLFRLPRPPSPPVVVLEEAYDWALPSLHALHSVTSSWYLHIYCSRNYNLNTLTSILFIISSIFYPISISFSRLYLGVHSLIDIITGFIPAILLLLSFVAIDDIIDAYVKSDNNAFFIIPVLVIIMLCLHPDSGIPTKSSQDTVCALGVALGMLLARIYNSKKDEIYFTSLMEQSHYQDLSYWQTFVLSSIRLIVGVSLILLTKIVIKLMMKPLVRSLFSYFKLQYYSYSYYNKTIVQISKHYTSDYSRTIDSDLHKKVCKEEETLGENGNVVVTNGTSKTYNYANGIAEKEQVLQRLKSSNASEDKHNHVGNGKMYATNGIKNTSHRHPSEKYQNIYTASEYWNIDIPCSFVTYVCMGWVSMNSCPHLFYYLNLNAF